MLPSTHLNAVEKAFSAAGERRPKRQGVDQVPETRKEIEKLPIIEIEVPVDKIDEVNFKLTELNTNQTLSDEESQHQDIDKENEEIYCIC